MIASDLSRIDRSYNPHWRFIPTSMLSCSNIIRSEIIRGNLGYPGVISGGMKHLDVAGWEHDGDFYGYRYGRNLLAFCRILCIGFRGSVRCGIPAISCLRRPSPPTRICAPPASLRAGNRTSRGTWGIRQQPRLPSRTPPCVPP